MAIFGNATVRDSNGLIIHNVTGTTTDVYLNYICGVLILIPFIISTLLNPVVFIYRYNQPRSAASLLYMILSASDFMTNLWRPLILSYELFKPELDDFLSEYTVTNIIRAFSFNFFSDLSSTTTACLAVMRFIAMQFPFYRPRKKILFWAIMVWTLLYMIPVNAFMLWVCQNQGNGIYVAWMRPQQALFIWETKHIFIKMVCIRYTMTTFISLAASGLTLRAMLKYKNTPNARPRNNKGCIVIVVMNAALIINVAISVIAAVPALFDPNYKFSEYKPGTLMILGFFLLWIGSNILSAFNPLIIVLFSSELKELIRVKLRLARVASAAHSPETQNEVAETHNDVTETQNEVADTQNEVVETQNEVVKMRNELVETQNDVVEMKNVNRMER